MGFELDDLDGIELDFGGTEYDGLEVRMRPTSIGGLLDVAVAAEQIEGLSDGLDPAEVKKRLRGVLEPLAGLLAGWNLTRGGKDVPADADGLLTLPAPLLTRLINAYVAAQAEAGPKAQSGSGSGGTSPEALIPMSPLN